MTAEEIDREIEEVRSDWDCRVPAPKGRLPARIDRLFSPHPLGRVARRSR